MREMSARFQFDFSMVRVHTDDRAAASAADIHALAYMAGLHIVFSHGAFQPSTRPGRELLATSWPMSFRLPPHVGPIGARGSGHDRGNQRPAPQRSIVALVPIVRQAARGNMRTADTDANCWQPGYAIRRHCAANRDANPKERPRNPAV